MSNLVLIKQKPEIISWSLYLDMIDKTPMIVCSSTVDLFQRTFQSMKRPINLLHFSYNIDELKDIAKPLGWTEDYIF